MYRTPIQVKVVAPVAEPLKRAFSWLSPSSIVYANVLLCSCLESVLNQDLSNPFIAIYTKHYCRWRQSARIPKPMKLSRLVLVENGRSKRWLLLGPSTFSLQAIPVDRMP